MSQFCPYSLIVLTLLVPGSLLTSVSSSSGIGIFGNSGFIFWSVRQTYSNHLLWIRPWVRPWHYRNGTIPAVMNLKVWQTAGIIGSRNMEFLGERREAAREGSCASRHDIAWTPLLILGMKTPVFPGGLEVGWEGEGLHLLQMSKYSQISCLIKSSFLPSALFKPLTYTNMACSAC